MFKKMGIKKALNVVVMGALTSAIAGSIKTNYGVVRAESKPKVVASHNIICNLLQTVAQETIDLTCLIGANQDPHTYRPTPSDRKAIEEAQLIFYGGYELEPQIAKLFTNKEIPTVALYEQAVNEPILAEAHHEEHHEESAEPAAESEKPEAKPEPDPHVWHNIENTVAMAKLLQSIFLQANPNAAEQYLANGTSFTEQLWQLDAWIKDQIATIPEGKKVLVTTHNSLNYYARAYSLDDYLTLQGISAESSPTASQIKDLSAKIEEAGVPTIFVESTTSDRVIKNVARAADVELSESPLYADGLGEAENYIEMMSHNTCAIVDGLGGECKSFEAGK